MVQIISEVEHHHSYFCVFANAIAPLLSITVNGAGSLPAFFASATAGKPDVPSSPAMRRLFARMGI
jgi:hypothetical protein